MTLIANDTDVSKAARYKAKASAPYQHYLLKTHASI